MTNSVNKKRRVLVLGGTGMLGHKLVQRLEGPHEVWCTVRTGFDEVERFGIYTAGRTIENVSVERETDLRRAIEASRPDVVVNAVGIIKQLPSSKDVITTLTVNSILPHRLAQLGEEYGFHLVCISTDCVFSGERGNYSETDPADALDLYGRSKNIGEVTAGNCLTIRTSIIGRELATAHSLVEWFLSNRGAKVKGYANAIYSGFPTVVFADILSELLQRESYLTGLFHVSSDPIDKYELLRMIDREFGAGVEIERFEDFRIDRSLDSTRFRQATGFAPLPWDEMVRLMAADAAPYASWRQ
ncbi:MAG: dTDP-4-dehydrorhamnose reductase family protein [Pyrinomonadaceae bacterium]